MYSNFQKSARIPKQTRSLQIIQPMTLFIYQPRDNQNGRALQEEPLSRENENSVTSLYKLVGKFLQLESYSKLKFIPVFFLTEHHAIKLYWVGGCIAPLIL
jgi:hypothetical protein